MVAQQSGMSFEKCTGKVRKSLKTLKTASNKCSAPPFTVEKNEELIKEILDKIPKKREKKGYEIVRTKCSDEDEAKAISLEELLSSVDNSDKKKKDESIKEKKEERKEKKDKLRLKRKRKHSYI
jgi:hypothetical protein